MTDGPIHGRITGPLVMIGFGSIGRGALPLLERHVEFDRSRAVVIDPDDHDTGRLERSGIRYLKAAITPENYRDILGPLLTNGEGQGFCVNLSVDTSSVDLMAYVRDATADVLGTPEPAVGRLATALLERLVDLHLGKPLRSRAFLKTIAKEFQ